MSCIAKPQRQITAPSNGKINIISVLVNEARQWPAVVRAAGSETPQEYAVWTFGDLYPPKIGAVEGPRRIILAYFGEEGQWGEGAQKWGNGEGLRPSTPRAVCAIGEYHPKLFDRLNMDPVTVIAPLPRVFLGERVVVNVQWLGTMRKVNHRCFQDIWRGHYWFAFEEETASE
ncbi:MAG: hypothetical protein HYW56_01835 [Candidatus Harrisonbacteria bacterium]|nr:hypothetical protein [Candidatus Harrisonbacteria bacterium]